jgi:hypothetical protein
MKHACLPLAVLVLLLAALPARADQIIGEWCPPGGSVSLVVKNHDDVTFAGASVQANVDRHHVDFIIPANLADSGSRFSADQLNDEQVRVTIGSKPAEIWTPCKPVS